MKRMRVAVMASGGGSNLQQLLDRFPLREGSTASAEVCLVVADRPGIGALERAARAAVPTAVAPPREFTSPESFGQRLLELFREHAVELIVLAGYLKMVPANVVAAYSNRMLNIHPALLPAFGGRGMFGRHVHQAVLEAGVKLSGCTVHFVNEQYDRGPIIAQRAVPVYHTDTVETLAARVLVQEHRVLPEAVDLVARGRARVSGAVVEVDGEDNPQA
ncbi:phosphoribosylglycinamide formyltransferase [bacterium]|nr:phosphoribosylglycinamide formyltransferase [bacterium]